MGRPDFSSAASRSSCVKSCWPAAARRSMVSSSSPSPSQSSRVVRPGFSNGKTRKICAEEPFVCTRAAPEWPFGEARAGCGEIAPQKKTIAVTERIRRIGRVAMSKCIVTDADWQEPYENFAVSDTSGESTRSAFCRTVLCPQALLRAFSQPRSAAPPEPRGRAKPRRTRGRPSPWRSKSILRRAPCGDNAHTALRFPSGRTTCQQEIEHAAFADKRAVLQNRAGAGRMVKHGGVELHGALKCIHRLDIMLLGKVGVPQIAVDRGHGFADLQSLPVIAHGLAIFLALVIDRPDVVEGIGVLRVRFRGLLIKALRNRKHCLLVISDAQLVQVNRVLRRLHDQLLVCLGRFGIFLPGHLQIGAALEIGQVGGRRGARRNNVLWFGFLPRHAYPRRSLPVSRMTVCRQ